MSASAALRTQSHLTNLEKIMLGIAAVGCYGAWYGLTRALGLPAQPGFSTSLIASKSVAGFPMILIALPILTLLASILVGRIRFEAGLFCAAIGLVVLPARGGDIRMSLQQAGSPMIYTTLAIECAVLGLIVLGTYLLLMRITATGLIAPPLDPPDDDPDTTSDRTTVVITQALGTLIMLTILCQAPTKGQALASVCLGSMISAMIIHQIYVVRGSVWYIAGTMLAGVIAYLYTGLFSPAGYQIGEVRGVFAGAARPLPLHYATLGVAGAIFGYWSSLVWHAGKKQKLAEVSA